MSRGEATNGAQQIVSLLRQHAFRDLFIEELGWDRLEQSLRIVRNDADYLLRPVAQKRGLAVFCCSLDRLELRDRRLIRHIQRQVRRYTHENIVIFTDYEETAQVWNWALQVYGRRTLMHREHPFRSNHPPAGFVQRLMNLRVNLEAEERLSLPNVSRSVQRTFDRSADQRIFFRNPRYLYESARLARELATCGHDALCRFIQFHDGLARWVARKFKYVGVELDDLEQMARIGLLAAAVRYDPNRGAAFSTFSFRCIWQACQRLIPAHAFSGWLRNDQFWRLAKLWRRFGRRPDTAARSKLFKRLRCDEIFGRWGVNILRICETEHVYQTRTLERELLRLPDPSEGVSDQLARQDDWRVLHEAIDSLGSRSASVLRRCFGLDDHPEHTLAEIADDLGLSRERVRQIKEDAIARLRKSLSLLAEQKALATISLSPDSQPDADPA